MKKHSLIAALLCLFLIASCASIQSFTARYNLLAPHMPKDGKDLQEKELSSDLTVGSWRYEESIRRLVMVGDAVTSEVEISSRELSLDVFGEKVLVNGTEDTLSATIGTWLKNTSEKYPVSVHLLKASGDKTLIVFSKLEVQEDKASGTADCYLYVRTLTKVPSSYTYKVVFDTDGAGEMAGLSVALGDKVQKPEDPALDGFVFKGWTVDGKAYSFSSPVKSDLVLKAVWEKEAPKGLTVCFVNDGTVVSESFVEPGSLAAEPAVPEKDGFSFTGWLTSGGSLYDFSSPVEEDIILEAGWVEFEKVETYAYNFFDTRFYYSQCKDVQWYVSGGYLHLSGPAPLYCAQESRQLSVAELSDGAYISFAPTGEEGYYSQTLYNSDGSVKLVLSVKGRISYFGDYGFLYKADADANNAWTEFCSFFYTRKGLNEDGSTPSVAEFPYVYEDVLDTSVLETYGR